jgi:hypothetical protein
LLPPEGRSPCPVPRPGPHRHRLGFVGGLLGRRGRARGNGWGLLGRNHRLRWPRKGKGHKSLSLWPLRQLPGQDLNLNRGNQKTLDGVFRPRRMSLFSGVFRRKPWHDAIL